MLSSSIIGYFVGKEMKKKFGRIVDKKIAERGKVILGDGIAAAKRVALDGLIISYGLPKIPDVGISKGHFLYGRTWFFCQRLGLLSYSRGTRKC